MGVSGAVFDVITGCESDRVGLLVGDGICREIARVFSGDPRGSVLGPLLLSLYTCDLPTILKNNFGGMQMTLPC